MSSGPLPRIGRLDPGIEADRPEVDVLVEIEPEPQQDALFEDPRRHRGMADRPQQDHVAVPKLIHDRLAAGPRRSPGTVRLPGRTARSS